MYVINRFIWQRLVDNNGRALSLLVLAAIAEILFTYLPVARVFKLIVFLILAGLTIALFLEYRSIYEEYKKLTEQNLRWMAQVAGPDLQQGCEDLRKAIQRRNPGYNQARALVRRLAIYLSAGIYSLEFLQDYLLSYDERFNLTKRESTYLMQAALVLNYPSGVAEQEIL